jgi:hypothetical protein
MPNFCGLFRSETPLRGEAHPPNYAVVGQDGEEHYYFLEPQVLAGLPERPGRVTKRKSVGRRFELKSDVKKIDWLLKASPEVAPDGTLLMGKIKANKRQLNDKEALCFALELALESDRERVPAICNRLLRAYPAVETRFTVEGIEFEREKIVEWTQQGALLQKVTDKKSSATREKKALASVMKIGDPQNVHLDSVKIAFAEQLISIRNKILQDRTLSQHHAESEMLNYLRSNREYPNAASGFAIAKKSDQNISNFDESNRSCLTILWNYIRSISDPAVQNLLKIALAAKLHEIDKERPCTFGMIERLIDVPTAIDVSIMPSISIPALRAELQTLAGKANEQIETEEAEYIAVVRSEVGQDHITGDPEEVLTTMKRDRFLQMANFEYCMLRGMSRTQVETEANRIFPEGMVL